MWTVDARCSQCINKPTCNDRIALIGDLSPLCNELNTDAKYQDSPGDGILVIVCQGFSTKPPA
jgi:hypothetical protein